MQKSNKKEKIYQYIQEGLRNITTHTGYYQEVDAKIVDDVKKLQEKVKTHSDIIIAMVVVVIIAFAGFVVDTIIFHVDNNKYFEKVSGIERQVLILENKIKYETIMKSEKDRLEKKADEQQNILENLKKQQTDLIDCLKDKKYWQYEQCFK